MAKSTFKLQAVRLTHRTSHKAGILMLVVAVALLGAVWSATNRQSVEMLFTFSIVTK